MKKIIFAITTLFAVGTAWADDAITIGGVEMSNSSNSAGFAAVKKKLGKWQGRMTQSLTGQSFDVSYEWAITSGEIRSPSESWKTVSRCSPLIVIRR